MKLWIIPDAMNYEMDKKHFGGSKFPDNVGQICENMFDGFSILCGAYYF